METKPEKKQITLANYINFPATQKFLEENLKEKKSQFVSNLLALTDSDFNLSQCDPKKMLMCAMNATALNLPLNKNLGYAYVIAYKKNNEYVPQFQIGAKGFKQLAMRSGQYQTMNSTEIREGELNWNKFTGEFSFNEEKPNAKVVGYLSYFKLLNGYEKSLYMTNDQMEAHALKYSQAYQSDIKNKTKRSCWSTDEREKMCLKTVIKLLLSREGLLSSEMETALTNDSDYEGEPKNNNRNTKDAEIIPQDDPIQSEKSEEFKKVEI